MIAASREEIIRLSRPFLTMGGEFLPADRRHLAIPLAIPGLKNGACPSPAASAPPHDLHARLWYTITHPILIQS